MHWKWMLNVKISLSVTYCIVKYRPNLNSSVSCVYVKENKSIKNFLICHKEVLLCSVVLVRQNDTS